MAQRMQLQNSGSASGVALAVSDPACSLVGAGTSCCLVYNYDVRMHSNQWLNEIPSVFSEADWWVIQLTPRVFFTVFRLASFVIVHRVQLFAIGASGTFPRVLHILHWLCSILLNLWILA